MAKRANKPLDREVVLSKFEQLTATINASIDSNFTPEQVAAGFTAIAVANMANAIKKISLQRGYDVTEYVLCCFGGAGAQVACMVAENLGINKILLHPYAGVLSAYGIGLADLRSTRVESVESVLTAEMMPNLKSLFDSLVDSDLNEDTQVIRKVNLKYVGTNSTLTIEFSTDIATMQQDFASEHQTRYGFIQPAKQLAIESISVELVQPMDTPEEEVLTRTRPINVPPNAIETVQIFALDSWHDAQVYRRQDLQPQDCIRGAAIVIEEISTIIIEPNWQATVSDRNCLILQRSPSI